MQIRSGITFPSNRRPSISHHLHPAPCRVAARQALTHTLRLLGALGAPALHPPQMKAPAAAAALRRQRATTAASGAPAAAAAAPRRRPAVRTRSTGFFVLSVLRSALPTPVRHLTENGHRWSAPYAPRPSQRLPGGSRGVPACFTSRAGRSSFRGAGPAPCGTFSGERDYVYGDVRGRGSVLHPLPSPRCGHRARGSVACSFCGCLARPSWAFLGEDFDLLLLHCVVGAIA